MFGTLLVCLLIVELSFYYLIRHPKILNHLPAYIQVKFHGIYVSNDMRYIQYDENCAQYDNQLGYTLKYGTCIFSGTEFSNIVNVNRLGLRDDEQSLNSPEIVVLGDSYAMGWGVDENETFSSIIENKSGMKVLNAGIPSYGTVREFEILKRIDLGALKYLIIQYSPNDYLENKYFYDQGNAYITFSLAEFEKWRDVHKRTTPYYKGKYTIILFKSIFSRFRSLFASKDDEISNIPDEESLFINVMEHYVQRMTLHGVKIIVFTSYGDNLSISKTRNLVSNSEILSSSDITVISPDYKVSSYFVLDGHFSPEGHKLYADLLLKEISSK